MKKTVCGLLFIAALICSHATFAYNSICNIAYVTPIGKVTFYHQASWSSYDFVQSNPPTANFVNIYTEVTAPVSGYAFTWYENIYHGGVETHFLVDPQDAYTSGNGFIEINVNAAYCWVAGTINNVPDPVITSPLTFTPNPVVVGQTVTANWVSQNASNCTHNGNSVGTQGPLVFTAAMQYNTNHTILCAAAGQPTASDSEVLTVEDPQCIVNGNLITPLPPYLGSPHPYPDDDTANMNSAARAAMEAYRTHVLSIGGSFTLTSAYRPAPYQTHLYEIYIRYAVLNSNDSACATIKTVIAAEKFLHQLGSPVGETSQHTAGNAFDANVLVPSGSGYTVDSLAAVYNYVRTVSGDHVHFLYTP